MNEPIDTLGDALPREITRVREEVLPAYIDIGPPGTFAVAMMRACLAQAEDATASGNVVGMLNAYERLKGFKL